MLGEHGCAHEEFYSRPDENQGRVEGSEPTVRLSGCPTALTLIYLCPTCAESGKTFDARDSTAVAVCYIA